MTDKQHRKYCICGARAVAAMRRLGHKGSHSELTAYCRRRALGHDKSSRALSNSEFDAVLAVFAGYSDMGDLEEQLRLLEQPVARILFAAKSYLDKLDIKEPGRRAYLAAIYKRVQSRRVQAGAEVFAIDNIPDDDFPLILGALNHTLEHKRNGRKSYGRRAPKTQPPTVAGDTQSDMPF